jgi:hemoglobin
LKGLCGRFSRIVQFPTKLRNVSQKFRLERSVDPVCVVFAGRQAGFTPGTVIAHRWDMNTAATNTQPTPLPSPYFELIGGEAGVVRLVNAFYRHMDTRPDARGIRAMHESDLASTKAVLVLYLCEWLGGPKAYSAQRGHPRLRMRHGGFAIGVSERDAWLACMRAALEDVGAAPELQSALMTAFFKTADWMRNTGPNPASTPTISTPTKESS